MSKLRKHRIAADSDRNIYISFFRCIILLKNFTENIFFFIKIKKKEKSLVCVQRFWHHAGIDMLGPNHEAMCEAFTFRRIALETINNNKLIVLWLGTHKSCVSLPVGSNTCHSPEPPKKSWNIITILSITRSTIWRTKPCVTCSNLLVL